VATLILNLNIFTKILSTRRDPDCDRWWLHWGYFRESGQFH